MLYKCLLIKPAFNILGNKYTIAGNQLLEMVQQQGLTGSQLPTTELTEATPERGSPPKTAQYKAAILTHNTLNQIPTPHPTSAHEENPRITNSLPAVKIHSKPEHHTTPGVTVRYIQH